MLVEPDDEADVLEEVSCDAKSAWRVEALNGVVELPVDEEDVPPPEVDVAPALEEEVAVPGVLEPVVDVVPPVASAPFVTAKTKNSGVDPALAPELLEACGSRDCRSAYRLLLLDGVINVGVDIALSSKKQWLH